MGAVDVGGVKKIHAPINRLLKHLHGLGIVARAVELAHPHTAQADGRDVQIGTQFSLLHGIALSKDGASMVFRCKIGNAFKWNSVFRYRKTHET